MCAAILDYVRTYVLDMLNGIDELRRHHQFTAVICLSPAQLLHSLVYVFMWVGYRPVYDAKTRTWRGIAMVARFLYG